MITNLAAYNNTHLFSYSSGSQKSKISLTGLDLSAGLVPPEGSGENPFPFWKTAGDYPSSLAHDPFSIPKSALPTLSPVLTLTLLHPSQKGTWGYQGPIQDNLKILNLNTPAKIPFAMKGNIHRFWGLECGYFGEPLFCLPPEENENMHFHCSYSR